MGLYGSCEYNAERGQGQVEGSGEGFQKCIVYRVCQRKEEKIRDNKLYPPWDVEPPLVLVFELELCSPIWM